MPLLSSRASGSVRAFGLTVLSALTSILETFNRSNQSGLGSIKGQVWKVWRGAWSIVSNKASSSSAAGDNALATLKFTKTDVTVSISGADPGMGAAFWVTDANNWYASVYTQNQACQTCSNCNAFSGGNCNQFAGGNCNSFTPGNCNAFTGGNCNAPAPGNCNVGSGVFCCFGFTPGNCTSPLTPGNCIVFNSANTGNRNPPFGFCHQPSGFNPPTCNTGSNAPSCNNGFCCAGDFNTWSPYCAGTTNPVICPNINFNPPTCSPGSTNPVNCASSNPVVCNAFFTFSCNCVTEHRISILRSLVGTVSTVSSSLFSALIQSFRTVILGNQATIQAFSTTTYTSQIGNSVIQSITTPQKTTQHGIIKSTSSLNQGSTIDEFGVS